MKFIRKTDLLILAFLLVLGTGGWLAYRALAAERPAVAEIYYGSELVESIPLTKGQDKTFSIPQNEHVVFHLYPDGSICFAESDCPDQICVRTGRISLPGQSAACLPNKIILKIVSADGSTGDGPDIIAH